MILNFFRQLSNLTGLPLIVVVCALMIFIAICIFGILILIKVKNIKKVMDILNHRLDIIGHQLSWQSWESENNPIDKDKLGARANHPTSPVYQRSLKFKNSADIKPPKKFGEAQVNNEIGTKIHELLKKSGKPIPYHDLTENLSKDYPGYNYDFFLEEIEDLQKEGKVEVQLIAGKLYFQIQKT